MTKITAFASLTDDQREQAASVLVHALAHEPSAWKTIEAARGEVALFLEGGRTGWAAVEDGSVVGWIGAILDSAHQWELHPLAVEPAQQGRGLGTKLVGTLEQTARSMGVTTVWLGTDDGFGGTNIFGADLYPNVLGKLQKLAPSTRHPFTFYRKLGYAVVGVLPDANGPGRHDILMAKRIS